MPVTVTVAVLATRTAILAFLVNNLCLKITLDFLPNNGGLMGFSFPILFYVF